MPKKKPRRSEEASEFFKELEGRASALRAIAQAQILTSELATRAPRETLRALQLVADGSAEHPVGTVLGDQILIDSNRWADAIVRAAKAWRICPGVGALDEHPIPDTGLGIEAGRRIFDLALSGASAAEVAKAIDKARAILGPASSPGVSRSDCELGILTFFRQIQRFFDGREWAPPSKSQSQLVASRKSEPLSGMRAEKGQPPPAASLPATDAGPKTAKRREPLDPTEQKILEALIAATERGEGQIIRQLMITAGVSSQSTVSRALARLRSIGHPIKNRRGGRGYWIDPGPSEKQ